MGTIRAPREKSGISLFGNCEFLYLVLNREIEKRPLLAGSSRQFQLRGPVVKMAAHNFAPAVPRATAEEIDKAWAPIESLIKKTWSIMVVGATDQSFTAMDWMQVYTAISNWHIYGPGRTQDANSAGSGCEDTDREKFREKMQGLITSLINAEKKKVRPRIQLLSSSFLTLLTLSPVDLARAPSR